MNPRIRVALDTTAILSFVRQGFDVGETLAELGDADTLAGLPVACLVEASLHAVDGDRLDLLAQHPATVVLDAHATDWRTLAELTTMTGAFGAACAALAAVDCDGWVLSARPWLYEKIADGELAIGVDG